MKKPAETYQCLGVTLRPRPRAHSKLQRFKGKRKDIEISAYETISFKHWRGVIYAELSFREQPYGLNGCVAGRTIAGALRNLERVVKSFVKALPAA